MPLVHFNWEENKQPALWLQTGTKGVPFSDEILFNNARWYIQLRWIVIGLLIVFQLSSILFSGILHTLGISLEGYWPLSVAFALGIANTFFLFLLLKKERKFFYSPFRLIWMQILFDLVCLIIVIHYIGSLNTPAPFLFIFHIALACIFFTIRSSFLVTLVCTVLYSACISLEYSGIYQPASILLNDVTYLNDQNSFNILFNSVSIIILFFLVWFVISRLSKIIRIREKQLLKAEEETNAAYREKDKYSVHMTHQLKSPLAAIGTNIALLTEGYCGEFPDEAKEVLDRIDKRSKHMGALILDVLKLERVKPGKSDDLSRTTININKILKQCIKDLTSTAATRNIEFDTDIKGIIHFFCIEEQITLMSNNLLSNAINYSHDGGTITVTSPVNKDEKSFSLSISDNGIGIHEEKLPLIFDEYYRTKEATRHNERSTGIGLSIVKNIAQNHGISISIDSEMDKGSTFTLIFPRLENKQL
jgi:signal transduction histidine kinase